jgi:hypothetical protein
MRDRRSLHPAAVTAAGFFAVVVYAVFVLPRMGVPHGEDEIYNLLSAYSFFLHGRFDVLFSQPLYEVVLKPFMQSLGSEGYGPRMLGAVSAGALFAIMTAWAWCVRGVSRAAVVLAAVGVAVSPLMHAGTMVTDRDCTIMIPIGLATMLCSYAAFRVRTFGVYATACALWTLFFWTKMSTPLLWAAVWTVFACASGRSVKDRAIDAMLPFVGAAAFVVSWSLFAPGWGVSFSQIFFFAAGGAASKGLLPLTQPAYLAANVFSLWWWLTPYVLYASAVAVWSAFRGAHDDPLAFLAAGCVAAVFAYCPTVAMDSGFPKYYLPAIPLMVYLAGKQIVRGGIMRRSLCWWLLGCAVFFAVACDDTMYRYRVDLRGAFVAGDGLRTACVSLLASAAKWCLPMAVIAVWGMRARKTAAWCTAMIAATGLVCMFVSAGKQVCAPYATTYSYGETGYAAMYACVAPWVKDGYALFAPKNIVYHVNRQGPFVGAAAMSDASYVLERIAEGKTVFVVSAASNGIATQRLFATKRMTDAFAAAGYMKRSSGSFDVWVPFGDAASPKRDDKEAA